MAQLQTSRPIRTNGRIGLPSSPAPRSRSLTGNTATIKADAPSRSHSAIGAVDRERQRMRTTSATSATANSVSAGVPPLPPLPSTLRPQRSLANLSSAYQAGPRHHPGVRRIARVPPPPLPIDDDMDELPNPHPPNPDEFPTDRKGSITSITSFSSSLSSNSSAPSLFSGNPVKSAASSTTSLGDEEGHQKEGSPAAPVPQKPVAGFGSALWNRVAVAAGNLTVSVTKAIESNISTYTGETTPPGQESRLTRAMKNYYLAKASDPSDLPEWLFEDRDRGVIGSLRVANATPHRDDASVSATQPAEKAEPTKASVVVGKPIISLAIPSNGARGMEGGNLSSAVSVNSANGRRTPTIRFAEQIHPRRASPASAVGEVVPDVPKIPFPKDGEDGRSPGRATLVNVRGKRPSARGLPSGVRLPRTPAPSGSVG
ncbi:hypothetical protein K474DRAFT_15234 [Panus rudis PR-1116 ss-1]|nr:hypothetical protein K474DRAFT_15234 [Panus rudis PR-1116 ss-1]